MHAGLQETSATLPANRHATRPLQCAYKLAGGHCHADATRKGPFVSLGILWNGTDMRLELSDYLIAAMVLCVLAFWIDWWWRK
jgi:hypothetical protein